MIQYISHSEAETIAYSAQFSANLKENNVICFFGDLGAGKTTFIKGMIRALSGDETISVSSPTFVYLNIYEGSKSIYHFDLYRLNGVDEFLTMGFDDYFTAGGICCIEWSERIEKLLPADCICVQMTHEAENCRRISINFGRPL